MNEKYILPKYGLEKFHCVRCGVFSRQLWSFLIANGDRTNENAFRYKHPSVQIFTANLGSDYAASKCDHCEDIVLWYKRQIVHPRAKSVEEPTSDMPQVVMDLYNEAANVFQDSPRASGALLRLALQHLLGAVGGVGKNINDDIKTIVASGVDPHTQKALDIIRVFGNSSAHPGEINIKENPELVLQIFPLLNFVVDKLITQGRVIDSLFDGLPIGIKDQINHRDEKNRDSSE